MCYENMYTKSISLPCLCSPYFASYPDSGQSTASFVNYSRIWHYKILLFSSVSSSIFRIFTIPLWLSPGFCCNFFSIHCIFVLFSSSYFFRLRMRSLLLALHIIPSLSVVLPHNSFHLIVLGACNGIIFFCCAAAFRLLLNFFCFFFVCYLLLLVFSTWFFVLNVKYCLWLAVSMVSFCC